MMDPLLVIRCDLQVFRCPPIFRIFIKVFKISDFLLLKPLSAIDKKKFFRF
jgi:hypothetical protein